MKRLTIAIALLSRLLTSQGQEISRHEADSLLTSLNRVNTDTGRMTIFCRLAEYQIFKPGEYKADLDSAETYLNQAARLNADIGSIDAKGYQTLIRSRLLRERGKDSLGRIAASQAVQILRTGPNKAHLARACRDLASFYNLLDPHEFRRMVRLVDSASELYRQTGNISEQADCLQYLANLYITSPCDSLSRAFQALNRCLAAHQSIHDIHDTRLIRVYQLYGEVYDQWGDYPKALKYKLLALKAAEDQGNTDMTMCEINNGIGVTLYNSKEDERARVYYRHALQVAEKFDDVDNAMTVVHNVVNSYNRSKRPDSALAFIKSLPKDILQSKTQDNYFDLQLCYLKTYVDLAKYPEAQRCYDTLIRIVNSNKAYEGYSLFLCGPMIDLYLATRQYALAAIYIRKEAQLGIVSSPKYRKSAYYHQYRLDSARGDYKLALASLMRYIKLTDSFYTETSSRQIKQLDVEYETVEKEHAIEIESKNIEILQSQTRLQESRLKQAALIRSVSFGAILLLLVVVGLIFSRYQIKQRQKKEIDEKNTQLQQLVAEKDDLLDTKEWLLKELHHRVKNNLQVMMSLQELQARNLTSDEALTAVHDSSNRLYAMSLIHQKLYKADGPDLINMRQYIGELVRHLADAFAPAKPIRLETDLTADIELDVTQAIPVGLILNEAITNVFKYAFTGRPADSSGAIPPPTLRIALYHIGQKEIELMIKDNGRGYAAAQDKNQRRSVGFSLMEALAEELEGNLKVLNEAGLTILLRFAPFKGKAPQRTVPLEADFA